MEKRSRLATFLSGLSVLAALLLLLGVCGYCYPAVGARMRQVVAGVEDSPVREAFSVLADGLEAGEPIRQTMSDTVQVLLGEKG